MPIKFWKKTKRKNPFEASLILDNPDIKIVEARYNEKPVFFGVGVSKQREREIATELGAEGIGGTYVTEKELEWKMLYNKDNMPTGFVPMNKLEDLIKTTTAVVSGSMSPYATTYKNFRPLEKEDSEKIERLFESIELGDWGVSFKNTLDNFFRFDPRFDHVEAWLFYGPEISYEKGERDPKKNNPRLKLVCNTITKKAYYVNRDVWEMIRDDRIRWHSDDEQDLEEWCTKMGYKLFKRAAREYDLLDMGN